MPDEITDRRTNDTDERVALVERFFSGTGRSYNFMVNAATFCIDRRWKRVLLARIPPDADAVLDLACGTGILTLAIARRCPRARVVGVELRAEYLDIARDRSRRLGVHNVEWVLSRAEDYDATGPFDVIVSSYLAKYADIGRLVEQHRSMTAPSGLVMAHDFTYPPTPRLEALFHLYFRVLRVVGGSLFPSWRTIYRELPALIARSRWCDEFDAALLKQGFEQIRREDLTLYGSAVISARAPRDA